MRSLMDWLNRGLLRLKALLRGNRIDREIDEELRFHLDMRVKQNIEEGMTAEEARREALRRFGRFAYIKDLSWDVKGGGELETLLKDIRYGIRMLIKRPVLTTVIVMTLASGIGANTAVFSVVDAVLLRPLPFDQPDRLVMAWIFSPKLQHLYDRLATSAANYSDWRAQNQSFEQMAAFRSWSWDLIGHGDPVRLEGAHVSSSLFSTLGVYPALGRAFSPEEEHEGNNNVVILSHALWRRDFGSDPQIIDKTITLTGQSFKVIGVMPAGFNFPGGANMPAGLQLPVRVDLWAPLTLTPQQLAERWTLNLSVVGRLKQDVSLEQAQADMSAVMKRISDVHTQGKADLTARLVPLREQMVSTVRPTLIILFVTVGFVLLIACANVANLSLARMAERRKEIAIRLALGAGRARVMRQLLTESLLLALLGGAVGLILTVWGINGIVALIPVDLPRMSEIAINGRILGFTLAVSLLTGILFGIAPAIQTRVSNLSGFLKEGARRTTDGLQSGRLRSLLVISEVALALMLLIGTGLLVRSFVTLVKVDPGLDPSGVIALDIILPFSPQSRYTEDGSRTAFFRQLIERLEALPGVERAGAVTTLPLSGAEESTAVYIEGREPSPDERHLAPNAHYATITPGYFEALGIPVKQGRDFTDQDKSDGLRVIIINEAFARRYWPDDDPIGNRIRVGFEREPRVIVGVAGNVKQTTLSAELHYATYIPQAQIHPYGMTVLIRAREGAGGVLAAARGEVAALDKDLPIGEVRTMEEVISASLAQARFSALLTGLFASVALILAAAGIYAVVSYYATQRRHEIGIRMALGAEAGDVMKLVIGHGLKLTFIGVALGFAAAFTLTRLMASLLFGVSATDPATFALTPLMLIAIALLACYIPGRRATRLDPMIALRYE